MTAPSLIERQGWRQWSLVKAVDVPAIREGAFDCFGVALGADARLIVITQDCDLVHASYVSEPACEAYLCEPLEPDETVNGNLTAAKNPRILIVLFRVDGHDRPFRIQANGKIIFRRQRLETLPPDLSIAVPAESVPILQRWLLNRIVRTAFPGTFNDRTQAARQKMAKLLKKGGEKLVGLYIGLSPWEELPPDQNYVVGLIGLVGDDLDFEQRIQLESRLGEIAVGFNQARGIESCDYQVRSESEFTLDLLRTYKLFPLDYLSLSGKPGGETPPLAG